MTTKTKNVRHEFGTNEKRFARVTKGKNGFEVDLFDKGNYIRTVYAHDHSETYAERIAENWVLKVLN